MLVCLGSHGQRIVLAVGLRRELPTTTANCAVIVATRTDPLWRLEAGSRSSRQQRLHQFAVDVGQSKIASLETVGQFGVVEAQQVQQRCVQVVHVNSVLHRVKAELIAFAQRRSQA